MIEPGNVVRHELIGLKAKVHESKDRSQVGAEGDVIDETLKTLVLRTEKGDIRFAKKDCVFDFVLPDGKVVRVDGRLLHARPEERIKKKLPKTWGSVR